MESKLLPNFPNSAKKVSNINANAKVSTTRRWLSSRPAHSPVSSLASGNVSRCDRRCDQAVVMTIGARKHRFHGPAAGVAQEVFQLRVDLAAGRLVAEA